MRKEAWSPKKAELLAPREGLASARGLGIARPGLSRGRGLGT